MNFVFVSVPVALSAVLKEASNIYVVDAGNTEQLF
jgi:hypothetical protein